MAKLLEVSMALSVIPSDLALFLIEARTRPIVPISKMPGSGDQTNEKKKTRPIAPSLAPKLPIEGG